MLPPRDFELSYVVSFLPFKQLCQFRRVCKSAKSICDAAIDLRKTYTYLYCSLERIKQAIDEDDHFTVKQWVLSPPQRVASPTKEEWIAERKARKQKEEETENYEDDPYDYDSSDSEGEANAYQMSRNGRASSQITQAFLYALESERCSAIYDTLIQGGANIEFQPGGGEADHYASVAGAMRPIHIACASANVAAVSSLCRGGVLVNSGVRFRYRGVTPTHATILAAKDDSDMAKREQILSVLIEHRANVCWGVVDGGKNALHSAVEKGLTSLVKILLTSPTCQAWRGCYKYGDKHLENFCEALPIHYAIIEKAPVEILKMLLEHAPETLNTPIKSYNTTYLLKPMHLAFMYGTPDMVRVLREAKANLTEPAKSGFGTAWLTGEELARKYNANVFSESVLAEFRVN